MGLRREGREAAVQFLFSKDLHPLEGQPSEDERRAFWEIHNAKKGARQFAEGLISGVTQHVAEIDERIASTAENFSIERLAGVDRNILRLAIYEFLKTPEVPRPVVINEAIEIAKKFASAESAAFVNGILDKISKELSPQS